MCGVQFSTPCYLPLRQLLLIPVVMISISLLSGFAFMINWYHGKASHRDITLWIFFFFFFVCKKALFLFLVRDFFSCCVFALFLFREERNRTKKKKIMLQTSSFQISNTHWNSSVEINLRSQRDKFLNQKFFPSKSPLGVMIFLFFF